jgi:tetratricopeptide (TPR) repeat protein
MTAQLDRALQFYNLGRTEMAEAELRLILAQNHADPFAHGLLAQCLSRLEKHDEAQREASWSIASAPDVPYGHYSLAVVLDARDELPAALAAIDEAIRLDPENESYFARRGVILYQMGRHADALAAADQGLELDPEHSVCINVRAMALTMLGRREEAGATLAGALQRAPEDALSHANLGWNHLHQGNAKKAEEHFREALRLDPEMKHARSGVVEALKARNPVYRFVLAYFLWMSRLGPKARFGVIVGGYFLFKALQKLQDRVPSTRPWIMPLLIAYIVWVALTWLADPLFNLVLRLHPFGRLALSRDQRISSNWVGITILLAIAALAFGIATGSQAAYLTAAATGFLALPVAGIFTCDRGWPRLAMIAFTLVVVLAGLATAILVLTNPPAPKGLPKPAVIPAVLFGIGLVTSTWVAALLSAVDVKPRRG